jgi:DNA-binding transcriptional LysR family regulator
MNIDRLRYFSAVVETRNLRKAAQLVGISAGSMSKAISVLGQELGVPLLRQEGRGIAITDDGMEVYRSATPLLIEFQRFERQRAKSIKTLIVAAEARVGTFEVFSTYFLSAFIGSCLPDGGLMALELPPGKIEEAVKSRLVEYGITYIPAPDPELEFQQVGRLEMAIFGSGAWRKHPFEEWPFAVPVTPLHIHSQGTHSLDMWPQADHPRFVKYRFELLETALQTSRMGLSVLHCPTFIPLLSNLAFRKDAHLEKLPYPKGIKGPLGANIYLVSKKGDKNASRFEGKLAKFVRSLV